MQINKINSNFPNFKGLLTISGPDKKADITLNTDNVSAVGNYAYIDKKDGALFGVGYINGATIMLNGISEIRTSAPTEKVIEAYKQAHKTGEYKLETKNAPILIKHVPIL